MTSAFQPAAWHDLFVATATGYAALLGLFVVAISLHLPHAERHPVVNHRARANIAALTALVITSVAVLIPNQPMTWLGGEVAVTWTAWLGLFFFGTWSLVRRSAKVTAVGWAVTIVSTVLGVTAAGAGISLAAGYGPGLYLLIPMILLAFAIGSINAWRILFAPELRDRIG